MKTTLAKAFLQELRLRLQPLAKKMKASPQRIHKASIANQSLRENSNCKIG
jgi:predicted transcriptional regulator